MKSWEELVNDGWSLWDWCGRCAARTEAKEKNFVTDSPDGKTHGIGVHDLLDGSRAHCSKLGDSSDTDIEAVREQ